MTALDLQTGGQNEVKGLETITLRTLRLVNI